MTDTYELPPLPELPEPPADLVKRGAWGLAAAYARAYGEACAKLERERCAAICDLVEVTQEIDHGAANTGGAFECAAAIRKG